MSTSASPEVEQDTAIQLRTTIKTFHAVTSVAYFKDGKRIISGSLDKTVRIWSTENHEQEGESLMHDFEVVDMALSPDERALLIGGEGVVLWDLEGRAVKWKTEKEDVDGYCVAYSPSGKWVAASHMFGIVLLDAKTGEWIREPLQFGKENSVWSLAFSPDGVRLAAGSGLGNVRVFDVMTGETIVGPFNTHTDGVTSLVFTLDGQQIVTASGDSFIRVWGAATGHEVGNPMPAHKDYLIDQIALNAADGKRIASASRDGTVRVWDLTTRRQIGDSLVQDQHRHGFWSVAWSPDGRFIVAGDGPTVASQDSPTIGNIHLWDVPPLEDVTVPVPTASTPAVLGVTPPIQYTSTPRSRANSLSSSILNLPIGSQPPASSYKLHDNFFDSDSIDLDDHEHTQIFSIPRTRPTVHSTNPKGAAVETQPPAWHFEALTRIWKRISMTAITGRPHSNPREDRGDGLGLRPPYPHPISTPPTNVPDMQPLPKPPHTSTSRVVKVSAGYGFSRTHAATSDEDDPVPCCDYLCFCMCCPCKRSLDPDSDLESDTES